MLEEGGVDRHHVLEVAVKRAILDHQDLAVALDDRGFDLADLLIEKDADVLLAVENVLPRLASAGGAERIGLTGPAEGRLGLLIRLEQRLVRPARDERRVLLDLVGRRKHLPHSVGGNRQTLLDVLHRRVHQRLLKISRLWFRRPGLVVWTVNFGSTQQDPPYNWLGGVPVPAMAPELRAESYGERLQIRPFFSGLAIQGRGLAARRVDWLTRPKESDMLKND